jgi:hypothetical protein
MKMRASRNWETTVPPGPPSERTVLLLKGRFCEDLSSWRSEVKKRWGSWLASGHHSFCDMNKNSKKEKPGREFNMIMNSDQQIVH